MQRKPLLRDLTRADRERAGRRPPGTTYFLPIIETTALTINALLELFGEDMGIFLRDERAWFRPAGVGRFARSKGGHLHDTA